MIGRATLEVRGLVRHFAGVRAVDGVSLQLAAGECVALIGPNGAGKSTTFACIAGQQQPDAGQVIWRGRSLLGLSPLQRVASGVGRTFQVAQLFDAPFNTLHAEGLGGVFPNQTQLDELVALVRGFGEPLQPPAPN